MSIIAKLLADIGIADIEGLIADGAAETQLLEFKEALPFKPVKGQPETSDRWISKGDRVGDLARDEILAEMVAFANADGGTLVLGLAEDHGDPARAREITPLPRCVELASRLTSAAEDVIEPRLASLSAKPIPTDHDGNGIVVLRCGRSVAGPHRLSTTREFYIRRGERTAKMTAREIRDMSLQLARSGDQYERLSGALRSESHHRFSTLAAANPPSPEQWDRLGLRSAAIPVTEMDLQDLTQRHSYFWRQNRIIATAGGEPFGMDYPTSEYGREPDTRLRTLQQPMYGDDELFRKLYANGACVFELLRSTQPARRPGMQPIYAGWCIALMAGTIAQAEWVKNVSGNDSMTFGLEFEIISERPLALLIGRDLSRGRVPPPGWAPPSFPSYELAPGTDLNILINTFVRDLYNAWGVNPPYEFSIDWRTFLPSI